MPPNVRGMYSPGVVAFSAAHWSVVHISWTVGTTSHGGSRPVVAQRPQESSHTATTSQPGKCAHVHRVAMAILRARIRPRSMNLGADSSSEDRHGDAMHMSTFSRLAGGSGVG